MMSTSVNSSAGQTSSSSSSQSRSKQAIDACNGDLGRVLHELANLQKTTEYDNESLSALKRYCAASVIKKNPPEAYQTDSAFFQMMQDTADLYGKMQQAAQVDTIWKTILKYKVGRNLGEMYLGKARWEASRGNLKAAIGTLRGVMESPGVLVGGETSKAREQVSQQLSIYLAEREKAQDPANKENDLNNSNLSIQLPGGSNASAHDRANTPQNAKLNTPMTGMTNVLQQGLPKSIEPGHRGEPNGNGANSTYRDNSGDRLFGSARRTIDKSLLASIASKRSAARLVQMREGSRDGSRERSWERNRNFGNGGGANGNDDSAPLFGNGSAVKRLGENPGTGMGMQAGHGVARSNSQERSMSSSNMRCGTNSGSSMNMRSNSLDRSSGGLPRAAAPAAGASSASHAQHAEKETRGEEGDHKQGKPSESQEKDESSKIWGASSEDMKKVPTDSSGGSPDKKQQQQQQMSKEERRREYELAEKKRLEGEELSRRQSVSMVLCDNTMNTNLSPIFEEHQYCHEHEEHQSSSGGSSRGSRQGEVGGGAGSRGGHQPPPQPPFFRAGNHNQPQVGGSSSSSSRHPDPARQRGGSGGGEQLFGAIPDGPVQSQNGPPLQLPPPTASYSSEEQTEPSDMVQIVDGHKVMYVNDIAYRKIGVVGRGGSSKVFKVSDPRTGKMLALKRVVTNNLQQFLLFKNEVDLLKKLVGKPNIIQIVDYEFVRQEKLLVLMEFGDSDFSRFLHSEPDLDFADIRRFWKQMLEAVQVVHEERIVHSDLKPANFLLVRNSLQLIDFGIAKAIPNNDTTNIQRDHQIGTLSYMAPEAVCQAHTGPVKLGRSSDIWSLGIILYQMIYKHTPFSHLNPMQRILTISDPRTSIDFPPCERLAYDQDSWLQLQDCMRACLKREVVDRAGIPELLSHPFLEKKTITDVHKAHFRGVMSKHLNLMKDVLTGTSSNASSSSCSTTGSLSDSAEAVIASVWADLSLLAAGKSGPGAGGDGGDIAQLRATLERWVAADVTPLVSSASSSAWASHNPKPPSAAASNISAGGAAAGEEELSPSSPESKRRRVGETEMRPPAFPPGGGAASASNSTRGSRFSKFQPRINNGGNGGGGNNTMAARLQQRYQTLG